MEIRNDSARNKRPSRRRAPALVERTLSGFQRYHLFTVLRDGEEVGVVEYWPHYGVVCPALCTSNGSARHVAACIAPRVAGGLYTVPQEWNLTEVDMTSALISRARVLREEHDKKERCSGGGSRA